MPGITFSRGWEEDLLAQKKLQTIRANADNLMRNAGIKPRGRKYHLEYYDIAAAEEHLKYPLHPRNDTRLHIWLGNPRHMRHHPWVRKLGTSTKKWYFYLLKGKHFTEDIAVRDGFGTVQELKKGLGELNGGMTMAEVDEHIWAVIRWKWEEGPHA